MDIEELLQRLDKVKKTGPNKWQARCPAHPDKTPSMSIKLGDDGQTILLHDFGGCSISDICGSIGIELTELFPPRENDGWKPQEKPVKIGTLKFGAIDALRCLASEANILLLLACDMAEGRVLSPEEIDRLTTSVSRLAVSLEYLNDNDVEKVTIS
jgi:hypothetical protein